MPKLDETPSARPEAAFGGRLAGTVPRGAAIGAVLAIAVTIAVLGGYTPTLPTPSPTAQTSVSPPAEPTPTSGSSLLSSGACVLLDPDDGFGAYVLSNRLTNAEIFGLKGREEHRVVNTSPEVWVVPPVETALHLEPTAPLRLRAADGTCIARVVAEYAPVGVGTPKAGARVPLQPAAFQRPNASVPFPALPEGDWVVHLLAHPFTALDLGENTPYVELYFRVISAGSSPSGPGPSVEPAWRPARPCELASAPPSAVSLDVSDAAPVAGQRTLLNWESQPVETPDPEAALPEVHVPTGAAAALLVAHDECSVGWTVRLGEEVISEIVNPDLDPAYASENELRLVLFAPQGAERTLDALLHFQGGDMVVRWRVVLEPLVPPVVTITDDAGTTALPAQGCGGGMTFANGTSSDVSCGPGLPAQPVGELTVEPGARLRIAAPDWNLTPDRVSCGGFVGAPPVFEEDPDCGRVALFADPPVVTLFAPRSGGDWMLEIYLIATSTHVSTTAPWYLTVHVP